MKLIRKPIKGKQLTPEQKRLKTDLNIAKLRARFPNGMYNYRAAFQLHWKEVTDRVHLTDDYQEDMYREMYFGDYDTIEHN